MIDRKKSRELTFDIIGDKRGSLVSLEELKNIPFPIKRVYYIFGTQPNVVRGKHAHTKLNQVLIAVSGTCKVRNFDGKNEQVFVLDTPTKGLYIGQLVWREMYDFSTDCVLMVLADEYYAEDEYIRDYETFLKVIANKKKFILDQKVKNDC